jgi:uncharacterized protein (TIGR02145 family)
MYYSVNMETKLKSLSSAVVVLAGFWFFLLGCTNNDGDNLGSTPKVVTAEVTNILDTNAIGGGSILSGDESIVSRGVCISTTQEPTVLDKITNDGTGDGSFSSRLKDLLANTTYYARAYAVTNNGVWYGQQVSFATTVPFIETVVPTEITATTALSGGVIKNASATIVGRGICWSQTPEPTLQNSFTKESGTGDFTSKLTALLRATPYFVRAYAITEADTVYGNVYSFTTEALDNNEMVDIDGNVYHTVTIGGDVWMQENLKTTHLNDGTPLQLGDLTNGYSFPQNDPTKKDTLGLLYTFYVVETNKLCPTGWHVPSLEEWEALVKSVDPDMTPVHQFSRPPQQSLIAGKYLKQAGTAHWPSPNDATNSTGFRGLATEGDGVGTSTHWWSSSIFNQDWGDFGVSETLQAGDQIIDIDEWTFSSSASVRCKK